jgi:ribosomal protein S18 acetylase RimI-like enzyme
MDKIESYDQCVKLIKEFTRKAGHITTNCYILPNEMRHMIDSKLIYYQISKDILVLYIDESDYMHIYYWITDETLPVIKQTEKVVVLDLVARGKENPEEQRWEKAGFKPYKLYTRMKYDLFNWHRHDISDLRDNLCAISPARASDLKNIYLLWRECLDWYSTPLPTESEIEWMAASGHIYCARHHTDIIGAVYMDAASKSCVLKHLSIGRDYRRQGFGSFLMDYALKAMVEEGIEKCILWVDIDNTPAYENYVKYGFEQDGLWSRQMIWRN